MVNYRLFISIASLFLCLQSCQVRGGTEAPSETMTLIPFETSTATISPSPITEVVDAQEEELLPSPTPFVHQVQEGETLLSIALRYGVSLDGMLAANPGLDPRFLSIDQELRIPGPEGQPADTLLPTSTPLPLFVSQAECYRNVDEVWWCLAEVENETDTAVEGLTARVRFLNGQGEVLESGLAFAPLNRLPAGGRLPLLASYPEESDGDVFAKFSLISAVGSEDENSRYVDIEVENIEYEPLVEDGYWRVTGDLTLAQEVGEGELRVSLLAMALDASDRIVGYSKWEPAAIEENSWRFETQIYSLGPAIQSIEVLAEAVQIEG